MFDLNDLATGPYLISDVGENLQVVTKENFAHRYMQHNLDP